MIFYSGWKLSNLSSALVSVCVRVLTTVDGPSFYVNIMLMLVYCAGELAVFFCDPELGFVYNHEVNYFPRDIFTRCLRQTHPL